MEITRKNFKESLEVVSKAIKDATFLAVDSEFTGLSMQGSGIHAFETPEERYKKLREAVSKYLMIQFGLAAFQYDEESKRYIARVFNFYIYPRPFARQAPDVRFMCQSSSLDFLSNQGFDFNKVIKDGISYLLPLDEERLIASVHEKHSSIDAQKNMLNVPQFSSPAFTSPQTGGTPVMKGPLIITDDNKPFVDNICAQLQEFLQSDKTELHLDPSNGYLRKLTFQTVSQRFNGVHLESKSDENRRRYILVTKVTGPEEMRKREEAKRQAEIDEVDDAVGFSKIIRMISKSGKLVVGHNMLLDVMQIVDKFCHPLPEDYDEFKQIVKNVLPYLLDTKHMATTGKFRDVINNTVLGQLHTILEAHPFNIPQIDESDEMKNYSTSKDQQHEAGYDAFLTGRCFIAMSNYLANGSGKDIMASSSEIEPFMNKLFLMRIVDIPYMNTAGDDIHPNRDHVFHLSFVKEWRVSDIQQLFSPYGNVYIAWLDESSAFVGLSKRDQAEQVLRSLPNTDIYQLSRYKDFVRRRRSLPSHVQPPIPNTAEKRKPSPVSDVELPRKKRRASRESPSPHLIPTIPEEVEPAGVEQKNENSSGEKGQALQRVDNETAQDIGVEVPRKKQRLTEPVAVFAEPEEW